MPGYKIIGANCCVYQFNGGAIHCLTRDIPANNPIYIKHKWLADRIEYTTENYKLEALVQSARGIDNVKLFWRLNNNDSYTEENMTLSGTDTYTFNIPYKNIGTEIEYYITATDKHSKSISKPFVAPKGTYKSKIVAIGSITHPDSLYSQPFFPCFPDGTAIENATISINNTTLITNASTNDTIVTIDLIPGTYSYTVSSPGIVGEYHGTVNVNNRYPDTVKVTVNPFEFLIRGQHGDTLNDAEISFKNYPFTTAPLTVNYAFEGDYNYEIKHPALIGASLGTITITPNVHGTNYANHIQQEEVKLNLDYYKVSIFPCLPDGTAKFETSIKINGTTLLSNLLTGDSIVNILLPPGNYLYRITSPSIVGEYSGTWQPDNSYTDTIKAIINPVKFLKNSKVIVGDSTYTADDSALVYVFAGNYHYIQTHASMFDKAYGTIDVVENSYGKDFGNHIPTGSADIAQISILIDGTPPAGAFFYKEKYPATDCVSISEDGKVYFAKSGTYNYEIFADRMSYVDTMTLKAGDTRAFNLFTLAYTPNNNNCQMAINNDTLCYDLRNNYIYMLNGEYPYTTFYKTGDTEIPLGSGVVSPFNKVITQKIYVLTYTMESDKGEVLTNAQLRTNTGNNVFTKSINTYGVVFKENTPVTCTVSCVGYKDSTFTAHSDDATHTLQLVPGTNTVYYTVTFVDHDGTVLSTQKVSEGGTASAPGNPTKSGYSFTGWDVDFTNVTSNLTVKAQYDLITSIINETEDNLKIYPNPVTNGWLYVESNRPIKNICLFDQLGNIIYTNEVNMETYSLNVSHLPSGMYFLKVNEKTFKVMIK